MPFIYIINIKHHRASGVQKQISMYEVTYEYRTPNGCGATRGVTNLLLHSASESEAISAMRRRGSLPANADVVILNIRKV